MNDHETKPTGSVDPRFAGTTDHAHIEHGHFLHGPIGHEHLGRGVRHLSDEDVKALAKELKTQFYSNLGEGVWAVIWKVIIWGSLVLAAYGVTKGIK